MGAAGKHVRVQWALGAIHVFTPSAYRHETADVVVYVHGYKRGADQVVAEHHLGEQFEESGLNALFIVPDAPRSRTDPLALPPLAELVAALEQQGIRVPGGQRIAVGHSGAYRSIAGWIDDPMLTRIILLDAVYGDPAPFVRFVAAAPERKLVIVAAQTEPAALALASRVDGAVRRSSLPMSAASFSEHERGARLLVIHSQYRHSEMVENGLVLPVVLTLTSRP